MEIIAIAINIKKGFFPELMISGCAMRNDTRLRFNTEVTTGTLTRN
jgi:hypothetical protein